MANKPDVPPAAGRGAAQAEREARLARALRDNLRRRKDQARAKADAAAATEGADAPPDDAQRSG